MRIIGKRILAVILGIVVLVGIFWGVMNLLPSGCEGLAWFPIIIICSTAVFFFCGVLSGIIQPPSSWPGTTSLLFSPGIWVGLFLVNDLFKGREMTGLDPIELILSFSLPTVFSWFGCRFGMYLKKEYLLRKQAVTSDTLGKET